MRKGLTLVAALLTALVFAVSCQPAAEAKKVIGISKIVSHPALDGVEQGIQDELAALNIDATYDLQNANGDPSAAATIASKFAADKVSIAVGIATPTAQALVNTIKDIPVIYTAVTDPVAAGLVASYEKGGDNVTGYSDQTFVKTQIEFLLKLVPSVKRLGFVYSSGEANAVTLAEQTKAAAAELGLEFVPSTVASSGEVKAATEAIAGKVDAFYVSTDNTVVSALPALLEVAKAKKLPVISADPSSAEGLDVLAAWGFDYYKMGRATGKLIADILSGAKKTVDVPTQYLTDAKDVSVLVNLDVAAAIGVTIPQDVIDSASIVVKDGTATKR